MSVTGALRARVLAVACDGYGSTKTIAAGRFTPLALDTTLEDAAVDALERRVEVRIARRGWVATPGGFDPKALVEYDVTVRVGYARTNAGGDWAEGLTEQHGTGIDDGIEDRAATDAYDLVMALSWHANVAGLSPDCFDLQAEGAGELRAPDAQRRVLEIPLVARLELDWQTAGTYAP